MSLFASFLFIVFLPQSKLTPFKLYLSTAAMIFLAKFLRSNEVLTSELK